MLGLFGSLDMASRSLQVQQELMTLTGQNLANSTNPNYADEQLSISESTPTMTPIGEERARACK